MIKELEIIQKPRLHLLEYIKDLSTEQLNKVPDGFNNNIIWNLTHLISAQHSLCYKRAGLEAPLDERFYMPYQPGTKPEKFVPAEEIDEIKALFITSLDRLDADIAKNIFSNYPAWTTRYGVELSSIDQAVKFLPFHDGIHTGYIWALKKLV